MATQNVSIVIGAQDKTGAAFKSATANMAAMKNAASSVNAALGALGAGLSLGAVVSFTKSVIDGIDKLNDISDATGASIENISALEDVAARTGTTMDTVTNALVKLNQTLNAADPGTAQAQALEAIGLSAEDLKRLDPADALVAISKALANYADNGDKARLMQEIFGKSLKEVAPLLKDLADNGRLVATVTTEQTQEAERFNKQLSALEKNINDVARALSSNFVTAVNRAIDEYKKFGLLPSLSTLIFGDQKYREDKRLVELTDELLTLENDIAALKSSSTALDAALLTKKKKRLDWVQDEIKIVQNNRKNLYASESTPAAALPSVGAIKTPVKTGAAAAKDPYAEARRYLDGLQRQIEKTQELSAVQQLGYDILAGRTGKMTAAQQQEALNLALKLDTTNAQIEAEKELTRISAERTKAEEAALEAFDKAQQADVERLTGNTPTMRAAAQQKDLQKLQDMLARGDIDEKIYAEAVIERFDLAGQKIQETNTLAQDLGMTFTSAFEDAIVGGKALSSVIAGLEADIMRLVTRKMVTEPLAGAITGMIAGGFGGSDFTSLLMSGGSFDGGGYTGAGARSGGLDGRGGFMAMLHPQETVVDHTRGQSAGASVNVTINQQFAAGTGRATVLQAAAEASRQLSYAGRNL